MKKIKVKVKFKNKKRGVKPITNLFGHKEYEVSVKSLPVRGKANKEMIELLADYFDVSKSDIKIKSGFTSRNKIVLIHEI